MLKRTLLAITGLICCGTLLAQQLDHRLGYIIVQLDAQTGIVDFQRDFQGRWASPVVAERSLSRRLNIHLLKFDHNRIHERDLLQTIRQARRVVAAQFDHLPELRLVPDDPRYTDQWQWQNTGQTGGLDDADIDADIAWEYSQGGLTANGDTIVVAIIDSGLDYNHVDITDNVWINYHEIDSNGIDDDGNGYVDDIFGWNAYDDNPDVYGEGHGLNVAGVVGAVGNNQTGITGINWKVKLMTIVGGTPESAVIASYAYALEQRAMYNESGGARGAFVVATNSSWGIDFGNPADAPLWCSFYDSLGAYGIISAAATSNQEYNVDEGLDLPTACPSEFLLSVTALDHNNSRNFSAYGLEHVDFGAPGQDVLTTRRNDNYGNSTGTSFASPAAAGVIALLYSAPCASFASFIKSDPANAARYIRDLIFAGIEPIPSLNGFTKFGGGLNAGNSMTRLMALCSECPLPFGIEAQVISDTDVRLTWSLIDDPDAINVRYKPLSATEWDTIENVSQPLFLNNLVGCTEYEIEFESACADTTTGYQVFHTFKTDGCCELPINIDFESTTNEIDIFWDGVLAADFFLLQWRPAGEAEWNEVDVFFNQYTIEELMECSNYEFRLLTDCDTAATDFSETFLVRTKGCGSCLDLEYCESSADPDDEFIDSLVIGPLVNHSGLNDGYALFDSIQPGYEVGEKYDIWLRPGFTGQNFNEQFRIWIDYDQNGEFSEAEMVLDSMLSSGETVLRSSITIPDTVLAGSTRMRVSMAFTFPFFMTNQEPCATSEDGEVEDYCIRILKNPDPCPEVDTLIFDAITFTRASMYWPAAEGAIAYTYRYREVGSPDFLELATVDTNAILIDLEKCKVYEVQLMTVCPSDTGGYVTYFTFETDCDVAVEDEFVWISKLNVYPNPTADQLNIALDVLHSGNYDLSLFNIHGQLITQRSQHIDQGAGHLWRLDALANRPPGIYFVRIGFEGRVVTRKVIKM